MAKKTNYDSEFCGSLPLNHINVVQSYGYLVVLDKINFRILQVSENCPDLFLTDFHSVIGKDLTEFCNTKQLKELQGRFAERSKEKIPLTLTILGKRLLSLAHFKDTHIILEIEKTYQAGERTFTNVYEEVKYAMATIESAETINEASQAAVHELRKITGFDGIMMYRFDEDWNGTVIAEEKEGNLENYLGHTFPASDVPKQARDLYLKNPYRLIPDREYEPVRLYPVINPVTNAFIDLSDCNLRGVAAVHLEYLKNMNVDASMSIRVICNNTLWGLIACHHLTPHYLNFELCSVCELISSVISNRISAILNKDLFEQETELQKYQTTLIAQVYAEHELIPGLMPEEGINVLTTFGAGGAVAFYQGAYRTIGEVPDRDMVENLLLWLQNKELDRVFNTDQLPELFDEAMPYAVIASGLLAIPVDKRNGEFLIIFRPEVVQTINWGGDPGKTINFDPDGTKYHPRASFKIWKELVHHTSEPWTKQELETAENLRTFIYEFRTKQANYN
ncbi:GAF domain-containing protein [Mucilaginibacter jinjuensis]|uniref:GAF domain-containing protein n=1 Tax=Mucilaginibacter jinjuensis TaxID=1176721 RepID=A0ABY7T3C1_9SPHI|nr:GAF domain-containing protein [Mucilaginibacter jinjuensis]WCT10690.1 GAF domain-containing protein [Mucilaginibacter jinjuensis]